MFKTFTTDFGENNFLLIVPILMMVVHTTLCFQIEKFLLTKLARASFGIDDVTFVKQKHLMCNSFLSDSMY